MHLKFTINHKLILVYLLIFTIPSILFSVFFYNNIKNQEQSLYLDASAQDSRAVAENVGKYVDLVHNIEWYIQNDYGLMDFIASDEKKTTADYLDFNRNIIKNIERMMEMNQDLYQVRIFAENSDLLEIWPHLYQNSTLESTEQQSRVRVSDPDIFWRLNHKEERMAFNREPSIDVVSYYKKLYYPAGTLIGTLEIAVNADRFWSDKQLPQGTSLFIFHEDQNIWFRAAGDPLPELTGEYGENLRKAAENAQNKPQILETGGMSCAVSSVPLDSMELSAVLVTDLSGYMESIRVKRDLVILTTLLLLIAITLITALTTNVLMRKLKIISRHVRKIQQGDLQAEIPLSGSDEFSALALSFNKMLRSLRDIIARLVKEETAAKTAELGALQAQIDSHFLYNTLENIKMKAVLQNRGEIAGDITALGKIMRYNLSWKSAFVSLSDELEHIRNYFSLYNLRNGNRFRLEIDAADKFLRIRIHKMLLQPLVENALLHGLHGRKEGTVRLRVYRETSFFCFTVEDDGVGFSPGDFKRLVEEETPPDEKPGGAPHNGIALKNVYDRLLLYYGDDAEMYPVSEAGRFTRMIIKIKSDRIENYGTNIDY